MPIQLIVGPGKTGIKLPKTPTITQTKPKINKIVSINKKLLNLNFTKIECNLKIFFIILLLVLNSCQLFVEKQLTENQILEKRLKEIDWTKVDVLPSFSECDFLKNKTDKKTCFFEFLQQKILEKLTKDKSVFKSDSLQIQVLLDKNGTFQFFDCNKNSVLDSILKVKLANFPRANPAIKQGIYVKSEFKFDLKIR